MIRAVAIGEAMVELRDAGAGLYARAIAGDAFNVAVYLARSLDGSDQVRFLTAIGDDALSDEILARLKAEGLDAASVFRVSDGLPGLYLIELDAEGDRSFHYWRSASAARRWYAELAAREGGEALEGLDLIYVSGISLAILSEDDRAGALAMLAGLKGRVGAIAFDPNIRPQLWENLAVARRTVEQVAAIADIVLPSEVDGRLIWSEADPAIQLNRYAALGAREIALTCGAAGAWLRTREGEVRLRAPAVDVLDTSGAGDSFNGAYLAARLRGRSSKEAAEAGLRLATRVVCARGALVAAGVSHPTQVQP